jgi:hypothetical protein
MIEGYCTRRSYAAGESVDLHVSTGAARFAIAVERQGTASETVLEQGGIEGALHPVPADSPVNGCGWPVAIRFGTDAAWRSGFYRVRLIAEDGKESEAFFILRAPEPRASILWVIETNTWNAYNLFGGSSTYAREEDFGTFGTGNVSASFERPLSKGFITLPPGGNLRFATVGPADVTIPYMGWAVEVGVSFWTGAASWSMQGARFARWLEEEGVAVDYAASSDLEEFPDLLDGYRLMLSVGHDEYWSWGMRDTVEAFIQAGGNAAFLSGNAAFWQVRFEDDFRRMIAYKYKVDEDPVLGTADERRNTGMWSHRLTGRPENQMTGLSFTRGGYARIAGATPASAGGYTIYRKNHWALADTGLAFGDQLGASSSIIGYEVDGCEFDFRHGQPFPTGRDGTPGNFEIIGIAPASLWSHETGPPGAYDDGFLPDLQLVAEQVEGNHEPETCARYEHGHACMGTYVSKGGGTVFSAGTTDWVYGLGDRQVAAVTRNVLLRLGARTG